VYLINCSTSTSQQCGDAGDIAARGDAAGSRAAYSEHHEVPASRDDVPNTTLIAHPTLTTQHPAHDQVIRLSPERIAVVADQRLVAEPPRALNWDHVIYD